MKQPIAILGAGAWGTALAHFFATQGHHVFLWCHENTVAQSINKDHKNNLFLQGILLPPHVFASTDIHAVLRDNVAFIVEAIPVTYLVSICTLIQQSYALKQYWILTSKGLDPATGNHSFQLMQQVFGTQLKALVLGGPSFASELVQKVPTAWVLAATDHAAYSLLQSHWRTVYTAVSFSDDIEGVSLAGALKNVVALLLGILDGAGYGKNTQACLLTSAYQEIKRLVVGYGGQEKTVDGLAGFGDLFLTVSTNTSKNRMYGYLVGQKKTVAEISKQLSVPPEGVSTAAGLHALFSNVHSIMDKEFPLLSSVHQILIGAQSIDTVVQKIFHVQTIN